MCSAFRERDMMVDFLRRTVDALLQALLAQGRLTDFSVPDPFPGASVYILVGWSLVSVVEVFGFRFVFRAVSLTVPGKVGTAVHPAGPFGFLRHSFHPRFRA